MNFLQGRYGFFLVIAGAALAFAIEVGDGHWVATFIVGFVAGDAWRSYWTGIERKRNG